MDSLIEGVYYEHLDKICDLKTIISDMQERIKSLEESIIHIEKRLDYRDGVDD